MWLIFILLPGGAACLLWFLAKLVPDQEAPNSQRVKPRPSILAEEWGMGRPRPAPKPISAQKVTS